MFKNILLHCFSIIVPLSIMVELECCWLWKRNCTYRLLNFSYHFIKCAFQNDLKKINIIYRPITIKDLIFRIQLVWLIFNLLCRECKCLINYQDHAREWCVLHPLKRKRTAIQCICHWKYWIYFLIFHCTLHFAEWQWI